MTPRKRKIKNKSPRKFLSYTIFLDPPPFHGERGGVSKMVTVPEEEIFLPTTPALWVKKLYSLFIVSI